MYVRCICVCIIHSEFSDETDITPSTPQKKGRKKNLPGSSLAVLVASWANARIRLNKTVLSLRRQAILLFFSN